MSTRIMKVATVILAVFIIVYVGFQLTRFSGEDYTYQTVYKQTVEENLSVTGIFFRDEKTFSVGRSGVVNCEYAVGEKVSSAAKLLSVYQNQDAIDRQREAKNLEETLASLEKAQSTSQTTDAIRPDTLNSVIGDYAAKLIAGRDQGDLSSVKALRSALTEAFARREIVVGAGVDYTGQIASIKERLAQLESLQENETAAVYTDVSGYFVDHVDGYENVCTSELLAGLTATQAEEMVKGYEGYKPDTSAVRVVTSQKWRFVVTVSEQETFSLREGGSVSLRFPNQSGSVTAVVEELRRDTDSGRFLVVLRGDTILPFLLEDRVQAAELLINSSTGLKVPKEALRFNENGQMGVYVVLMDKMYFRAVGESYENDNFILSPLDYASEDGTPALKLYDTIIVGGVDLYDQKPIS